MKRILIIEDDMTAQNVYQKKLSLEGFQVDVAGTGQEGLKALKANPPDLLILDIILPGGINGFDILEQIKKDPNSDKLPVIILSNLDSEQNIAKDIGANEYLIKANTPLEEIVRKVKKYLQ